MIKFKTLLYESTIDNTFQMYHGGTKWSRIPDEILGSKSGRYEGGVGIYCTNSYMTARKYAKGSKVVQRVYIDRHFKDIDDVKVPVNDQITFLNQLQGLKHRNVIVADLRRHSERVQNSNISLSILNNLIVNHESGAGKVGIQIANYFVQMGADASYFHHSGDEYWMVIFNPHIIKRVEIVSPKTVTSEFPFMLPKLNESALIGDEARIRDAYLFFSQDLSLPTNKINLSFVDLPNDVQAQVVVSKRGGIKLYNVQMKKGSVMSDDEQIRHLAHEMVHIHQLETGRFDLERYSWDDTVYPKPTTDSEEKELPWEKDARRRSYTMMDLFNRSRRGQRSTGT